MDDTLLLPPADTPLTGIDFTRRLPCGDTEKARRVYIIICIVHTNEMYE